MTTQQLKKRTEGFTIIEVLIVLAIAGLIMVIVFLAVPALQRNSRNTQRSSDVSKIAAAINECVSNNNGQLGNCDSTAEIDPAYITIANNQQITTGFAAAAGVNAATFATNQQCNAAGTALAAGGGARAFAMTYLAETSNGTQLRCLSS